jgi:Bacterial PH domain
MWRAGAFVADDRLVVRNVLRSRTVPWSEVAAFSPASDDPRLHSVGVTTVDGRRVSCTAMRPMAGWDLVNGPRFAERSAQSAAANLLAIAVERHRPARYQSPPGSAAGTSAWVGANSPDGDGGV